MPSASTNDRRMTRPSFSRGGVRLGARPARLRSIGCRCALISRLLRSAQGREAMPPAQRPQSFAGKGGEKLVTFGAGDHKNFLRRFNINIPKRWSLQGSVECAARSASAAALHRHDSVIDTAVAAATYSVQSTA